MSETDDKHYDAELDEARDSQPAAPLTAPTCTASDCPIPGPHGHVTVGSAPDCALCRHKLHDGKRCHVDGCECFPGGTIYENPAPLSPEENVPIGDCPSCGSPVYTDVGFCGGCRGR